ncbi:MAG: tRNA 4-thiouridine(8) synthase ThiI [Clostridia bacterium]|nr:tRNA 4-thiouridine(8) synthase ThiI [Clostridia bacterium]
MKEVILCKYGELLLKGANRSTFEARLCKELRQRAALCGHFSVTYAQSTVFIEPQDDFCDMDAMEDAALHIFGVVGVTRAAVAEKNMEDILRVCKDYLPGRLTGVKTFKADAKRSDKRFPAGSPEIAAEVGGAVLAAVPGIRGDVHHPDVVVRVEIRENGAYIHAGQKKGAGGMPPRLGGRGLLLLSGGIDSPVAGFMMAKRGMDVEALHFESFPYTSDMARDKVFSLAEKVCAYTGRMYIHVISLTHIQEELRDKCDEEYFTLLLRVFMMTLAERCARDYHDMCLITGESLGQVASQTMEAIAVTDSVVSMPVFRPCIGLDKEEIVTVARMIDTFETSILPYEDCCTVFTPRHPRTRPEKDKVMAELAKVDFKALSDEAYAGMYTAKRSIFPGENRDTDKPENENG